MCNINYYKKEKTSQMNALPRKRNGIVPSFLSLGSFIIYAYNEDKNYWLIQVAYREHLYRITRKNE